MKKSEGKDKIGLLKEYLNNHMDDKLLDEYTKVLVKEHFEEEQFKKRLTRVLSDEIEEKSTRENSPLKVKKNYLNIIRAATVSIAACMAIFFYFNGNVEEDVQGLSFEDIIQEYQNIPFENRNAIKSSDEPVIELKELAYEAYSNKDYNLSIDYFKKYALEESLSEEDKFYNALSFFYNKNFENAIEIFNDLVDEKSQYEDVSKWFLSLAFIQNDQPQLSLPILNEIKLWNGNSGKREMAEQAEVLINYIDGMIKE